MQTNDTGENYRPLGTGVCSQVHKRFHLNCFFLIMLMQPYFLVHFVEENIQCACVHQNILKHIIQVAYNNRARKMLINAPVLLSRGDEFASCEVKYFAWMSKKISLLMFHNFYAVFLKTDAKLSIFYLARVTFKISSIINIRFFENA